MREKASVLPILHPLVVPVVGKYGYSTMFYLFAGFTVVYLLTAAFFLPETKGKTLEEIERIFDRTDRPETSSIAS